MAETTPKSYGGQKDSVKKNPKTSQGIESDTFRLVAKSLNQLFHQLPRCRFFGYPCRMTYLNPNLSKYIGADKSLARPGRKQARATEDFDVHISYL
jgi:hypothetical protein